MSWASEFRPRMSQNLSFSHLQLVRKHQKFCWSCFLISWSPFHTRLPHASHAFFQFFGTHKWRKEIVLQVTKPRDTSLLCWWTARSWWHLTGTPLHFGGLETKTKHKTPQMSKQKLVSNRKKISEQNIAKWGHHKSISWDVFFSKWKLPPTREPLLNAVAPLWHLVVTNLDPGPKDQRQLKEPCTHVTSQIRGVSKNRGGPPKWMVYNGKPY